MKEKSKSSCGKKHISKSRSFSGGSGSKVDSCTNSCFRNMPKDSGRLSASFYAKK